MSNNRLKMSIPIDDSFMRSLDFLAQIERETGLGGSVGERSEIERVDGSIYEFDPLDYALLKSGSLTLSEYMSKHKTFPWSFDTWANGYFANRKNQYIDLEDAIYDCSLHCIPIEATRNVFRKKLHGWASRWNIDVNPPNLCTPFTNGRILRRRDGNTGPVVDWIYISEQTKKIGGALWP